MQEYPSLCRRENGLHSPWCSNLDDEKRIQEAPIGLREAPPSPGGDPDYRENQATQIKNWNADLIVIKSPDNLAIQRENIPHQTQKPSAFGKTFCPGRPLDR